MNPKYYPRLREFQSTLLHEERPLAGVLPLRGLCFNPRSCTRSDGDSSRMTSIASCFNPRSCTRSDRPVDPSWLL